MVLCRNFQYKKNFLTSNFLFCSHPLLERRVHTESINIDLYLWLFAWHLYSRVCFVGDTDLHFTMVACIWCCTFDWCCSHHRTESGITKFNQIGYSDWQYSGSTLSIGRRIHATFLPYTSG